MSTVNLTTKIAVLGGGQLGRMMLQEVSRYHLNIEILDPTPDAPAAALAARFVQGDFKDYDTVMEFCAEADVVTIEIEHVNLEALKALEQQGKKVFPQPAILEIIKDKGLQKQFYQQRGIPTAPFRLVDGDLADHVDFFPCMQKSRTGGYDGKGVYPLKSEGDIENALSGPSMLEKWVDFTTEIAVIVARNESGQTAVFPVVEMEFNPEANLVELLFCPTQVSQEIQARAEQVALQVANDLGMIGLLAVEMFVTKEGEVWVNEVAPRPHNSGHHTIECCYTSQYEQHIRAILNWPLGDTKLIQPAVMINLLGDKDHKGEVHYRGLEEALDQSGVYVHLYGKSKTAPYRKMGHVTVMKPSLEEAKQVARTLMNRIKVVSVDNSK